MYYGCAGPRNTLRQAALLDTHPPKGDGASRVANCGQSTHRTSEARRQGGRREVGQRR